MTVPVDVDDAGSTPQAGRGRPNRSVEAGVRWALVGLLIFMVIGLSFGLGFGTRLLLDRNTGTAGAADTTTTSGTLRKDGTPDFRVLDEIYRTLRDNFVDPSRIDAETLRTAAINGVINAVGDPHQVYLTKFQSEYEDDQLQGQFEGIGCNVDKKGGEILCVRPYDDSPAKKAGVRAGDVILAVDGESTKDFTVRDLQRKVRGPAGTTVKLQVRHTDGKTEEVSITRDKILLNSVRPDKAQDAQGNVVEDVAYVRIEQFTQRTPAELKSYLQSIQGQSYKGLIIDLRNNPGGLLSSVINVAEQFMKNQTVLIERMRDGSEKRYTTRDSGLFTDPSFKVAVLVNHNSASASELLSGALRDNNRATVLGETTLGKGTVNQFFDLRTDGGKLYVTIANWLTPKRDLIEGKGVKPDIEVKVADNEDPLGYYNSVMYRAVDLLRNGS